MTPTLPKIAFFGSPHIAVWVLEELEKGGIVPSLVVSNPDTPQGRKLLIAPTAVSAWAEERSIPILKPESPYEEAFISALGESGCELFLVAAYGKILPETVLNIPKHKTLNWHPSLLPKLRGPSPVRSAILEDMNPTGVSIMILSREMDEGPIVAQEEVLIPKESWPMRGYELDELLARKGGELLVRVLPDWIAGNITPKEQEHKEATYTKKLTKEMGLVHLNDDPYKNFLKIRALDSWPGTFFFCEKNGQHIRVKITDALFEDGTLKITKVIPEGKNEMPYEDFMRSIAG